MQRTTWTARLAIAVVTLCGGVVVSNGVAGAKSGPVNPSADLSVRITAQPQPAIAGDDITVTVTVTNAGPSASRSTTLNYNVGLAARTAHSTSGECFVAPDRAPQFQCDFADVAPRTTVTAEFVVATSEAGRWESDALVRSNEVADPAWSNNTAAMTLAVDPDPANPELSSCGQSAPLNTAGCLDAFWLPTATAVELRLDPGTYTGTIEAYVYRWAATTGYELEGSVRGTYAIGVDTGCVAAADVSCAAASFRSITLNLPAGDHEVHVAVPSIPPGSITVTVPAPNYELCWAPDKQIAPTVCYVPSPYERPLFSRKIADRPGAPNAAGSFEVSVVRL
jgi:hypothetical protein